MSIVDIPNRICPHCGGTRWVLWKNNKGYIVHICHAKKIAYTRKYNASDKSKLTNYKWRQTDRAKEILKLARAKLYNKAYKNEFCGGKARALAATHFRVTVSQLTEEQFNKYREYIKTFRLWRQLQANNSSPA